MALPQPQALRARNGYDRSRWPYVIAQDGTIAYAEVNADYTRRPEPSAVFPVLEQLGRRA